MVSGRLHKLKRISFAVLAFVLLTALPSQALDIPDEQISKPGPPVSGVGGYSGAYYDDQSTLFRAFTYVEAWSEGSFTNAKITLCKSALIEPCKSSNRVFFETPLSPCSDTRSKDCINDFALRIGEADWLKGNLVSTLSADWGDIARYNTPFKGDPKRGIPDSGQASIWTFEGISHQGGTEFLVIPKLNVLFQNREGSRPSNLDVGVFAVSKSTKANECFFRTLQACYVRWPLPIDSSFRIGIQTQSKLVGWFHGRVSEPVISSSKISDGQTSVSIQGKSITVPTVAVWAKNTDLPANLEKMIEDEFQSRGKRPAGTTYFGGDAKDRSKLATIDDRNPAFDDAFFKRYLLWLKIAEDKAYTNVSTWSFRSMEDSGEYSQCIGNKGVAGMVTTNSNAYIAGPPKFNGSDLVYKVGSPHYTSKGEVQIGTYDLAIRSDVARCIYGFSSAPIQAKLSVIYADGETQNATTVIAEKDNWLRLSAKGFTYSSPTVKVKLTQKKNQTYSINCVKGSKSKKVTGTSPKCPSGFRKAA